MKSIKNTTHGPLRVPLPRGGVLHLGPLRTGEVAPAALEHPPFKKLVEAGSIEVVGDGDRSVPHPVKRERGHSESHGHARAATRPSGDR